MYWPNDIAIIKLESDLNVSNFVGVLNSSINNSYDVNGTYKAIGHGYVNGNVAGGTRLLETTLTFVPFATCSAYYGANLGPGHVCFTGPQIGSYRNSTCSGDSGGPVYWIVALDMCKLGSPVLDHQPVAIQRCRYLGIHGSIRLLQLDITCHEWIRDAQILRYRK